MKKVFVSQNIVLLMTITTISGMPMQNGVQQDEVRNDNKNRHDIIFLPQNMSETEKQKIDDSFKKIYISINKPKNLKKCDFANSFNQDGTYEVVLKMESGEVDYLLLKNIDECRLKINKNCCNTNNMITKYYVVLKDFDLVGEPCRWKTCACS